MPQPPALLPVLSRGKHRNPRKGACFMEFASLLAGERWSDHPACTHPLLAAVAQLFGMEPLRREAPDEATCLGAGLAAARLLQHKVATIG